NIDENVILDKKISIYYFDDEILVDLYVKRSNDLKRLSDKLSKISYRGYNICVTLYCNLANS
ncbi:cation transporter, partial [Francisella tularensis subsp. holarctica]|nr:cation transporter [Francisella tularensis subsp. holarctica]